MSERLEKEAHRIASVMYQQAGGPAGRAGRLADRRDAEAAARPGGDARGKKKDGGVIDAEFEETP